MKIFNDHSLELTEFFSNPSPSPLAPRPSPPPLIRPCIETDFSTIHAIINDAAVAYRGVIALDFWHEPYMSEAALEEEIRSGVRFWGWDEDGILLGVMGIQDVKDVTLIRHAYVRTIQRNRGIGTRLLAHLRTLTQRPLLIGTWATADWAIRFYVKNGFRLVGESEKATLLRKYWSITDRQIETSVVLREAHGLRRPLCWPM